MPDIGHHDPPQTGRGAVNTDDHNSNCTANERIDTGVDKQLLTSNDLGCDICSGTENTSNRNNQSDEVTEFCIPIPKIGRNRYIAVFAYPTSRDEGEQSEGQCCTDTIPAGSHTVLCTVGSTANHDASTNV